MGHVLRDFCGKSGAAGLPPLSRIFRKKHQNMARPSGLQNLSTTGGLTLAKGTTLCGRRALDIEQILQNLNPILIQGHALASVSSPGLLSAVSTPASSGIEANIGKNQYRHNDAKTCHRLDAMGV